MNKPRKFPQDPLQPSITPTNGVSFDSPSLRVFIKSLVPGAVLRYTTHGHYPTEDDPHVPPDGLMITNTTRIRARSWEGDFAALAVEATIAKAGVDSDSDWLPDSWEATYFPGQNCKSD